MTTDRASMRDDPAPLARRTGRAPGSRIDQPAALERQAQLERRLDLDSEATPGPRTRLDRLSDAGRPDAAQSDVAQSDAAQSDAAQSDAAQSDAGQSDASPRTGLGQHATSGEHGPLDRSARPDMSAAPGPVLRFEFAPALVMEARGDAGSRRHLVDEYRSALRPAPARPSSPGGEEREQLLEATAGAGVALELSNGPLISTTRSDTSFRDGRRITRWTVRLGDPREVPVRVGISVAGVFGRSFVQGIVVEPVLGLAAARSGRVLLPAAAFALREGLVLVLGESRAGKSSLTARALAAGHRVLGDDQVILEADGSVWPFPRRLRLYPDLVDTAPLAYRALPPGARRRLEALGIVSALTGGLVGLPLLVPAELIERGARRIRAEERRHRFASTALGLAPGQLGAGEFAHGPFGSSALGTLGDRLGGPLGEEEPGSEEPGADPVRNGSIVPVAVTGIWAPGGVSAGPSSRSEPERNLGRVIVLDHGSSSSPAVDALSPDELVAVAGQLIDGQRARLIDRAGDAWRDAFDSVVPGERSILASAFRNVNGERLRVPVDWPVARVFDALAVELGLER